MFEYINTKILYGQINPQGLDERHGRPSDLGYFSRMEIQLFQGLERGYSIFEQVRLGQYNAWYPEMITLSDPSAFLYWKSLILSESSLVLSRLN